MYNTIIIGGGAAGLFTAANLKGNNNLLLEGTKKLGQKILITGGGMCNLTNLDEPDIFLTKFGDKNKQKFLKPAILNFSTKSTREWFEHIGLELIARDDGKVFPKTLKAQSVIDILYKELTNNGCKIKYNSKITSIKEGKTGFTLKCGETEYNCLNLVVTTGGMSFPTTGSDGSGYTLVQKLGHKIINPTPALTSVKIENYNFKSVSGNSITNSNLDFFRKDETKKYLNKTGDILFTHQGLSGPGILNNSREICNGDVIYLSLVSCINKEEKREDLKKNLTHSAKYIIKRYLKEIGLTTSLSILLCEIISVDINKKCTNLSKNEKKALINSLLNLKFTVKEKLGFNGAMVTSGGVDITEINRKTMESKLKKDLFFAGEVIDIDGDTGGYNLQAAFSSAKLVADCINKKT